MLKAILFDFNGVIINDEPLHEKLIEQILIEENLRLKPEEFRQVCLGRSDRVCLEELLNRRGRIVNEGYLEELAARKSRYYQQQLAALEKLPIYPGLDDLIFKLRAAQIKLAIVSGALRSEIDLVLERTNLSQHFPIIVSGDDRVNSKPEPDGYLLAVERLNQHDSEMNLKPTDCLAIEDTFAGIQAAKQAGMQVVGVANSYPFHMMQRHADWAVDYLFDLELDRVQQLYASTSNASDKAT
ncbi:MAG: HAD family phosphatase [Scytolyngbya sp. HA4215-MV1]|nr:HAD family phosphatase [Scytolyngbya sp. HA4215-MV1]